MPPPALTRDQAERLREDVGRHLRYLRRCRLRMEQLGYVSSDPLYGAVCDACNSVQGVFVLAHYASCKPKDPPAEPESAVTELHLPREDLYAQTIPSAATTIPTHRPQDVDETT